MSPRVGLDIKDGVESVTLASLAQRLGVRSPSLYNHVNGLPALRSHLAVYGLTRLDEALERGTMGRTDKEAVVGIADAYLNFAREHPGLYALTLQSPAAEHSEQVRVGERLVARLLHVLEPFGLSEAEGIHAVRGLRSLLHGFASIESQGGFGMPIDIQASLLFVLDRFLKGLNGPNR
jgi:AcrR family transcriptional regulator